MLNTMYLPKYQTKKNARCKPAEDCACATSAELSVVFKVQEATAIYLALIAANPLLSTFSPCNQLS